jgi:F0F1-type ATP synthase assembly protein I
MAGRPGSEKKAWANAWKDALRAGALGWDLAVPICGGALLGHALDRRFGMGTTGTLGLLTGGIIVGVYNVARRLGAEIRRDHSQEHREGTGEQEDRE